MDRAIDDPSESNVRAYYYAQRLMMDRAQAFSDVARRVTESDPLLDENLRVPFASAARAALYQNAKRSTGDILRSLEGRAAVWVFHDPACVYCTEQVRPINELVRRYGLTVEYVSKAGKSVPGLDSRIRVRLETGQFERLGVKVTPAVMLVIPPEGFHLVAQGFASLTELERRLVAVGHRAGLIDDEDYREAVPTARGVMLAQNAPVEERDAVDWDDPDAWVEYLQRMLSETYGMGADQDGD
jgi:conjugal transfer pilus assembly protein TraF